MLPLHRYVLIVAAMLVIATVIRVVFGVSSGVTLMILLIGWPVMGTLVTIDDDFPGGWSNPDGTYVPEWKKLWWWADLFLVRGSIVAGAFATERSLTGVPALPLWGACVIMLFIGLPVFLRGVREEVQ